MANEATPIKLSPAESKQFMDALENPPEPTPALRAAAERYCCTNCPTSSWSRRALVAAKENQHGQ